ncbi:hypothetical protein Nepgr_029188 [Nepenthes gracilis]|uniref:DYW domain-containing protein n=1 Tax=Nepenthes gracilis TaxID=150966 RepID=A0AAD3Y4M3_NEPGR|nr:hypothetical protein Nepgr_029188 [Nepenthes gracilis]
MSTRLFNRFHLSIFSSLNSATSSLSCTRQAHAHILKTGIFSDTCLSTKLLTLYANHQSFADAILILDSFPERDLLSFSTLINALSKFNRFSSVLRVFARMLSDGILPDCFLLPAAAKACAGIGAVDAGLQLHGLISVSGHASNSVVRSSLFHMYVKCDKLSYAHKLLDEMPEPDMVTLSALIAGYARNGCLDKAKRLFYEMGNLGLKPNVVSWKGMIAGFNQSGLYSEAVDVFREMHLGGFQPDGGCVSSVLAALGDLEGINVGVQIHDYVIKQGLALDEWVVSALIDMYGKCARMSEMCMVFDEIGYMEIGSCNALITGLSRNGLVEKALAMFSQIRNQEMGLNIVSWTSMIACCTQNGRDIEALELFREMQLTGVKANAVTIPCLLPACGNIAALMHGKSAHCFSIRRVIICDVYVGSALVDMYAKCGKIRESRLCFDAMPTKNLVSWNTIVHGYAMHGKAKEAMEMLDLMQKSGQKPNSISFTSVLSACSQKGLTGEGWYYFGIMSNEHGIEPKMEHYACMVTLLSRAGKIREAYFMIKKMPFEPDACVWGALLCSCRVHNDVKLAEVAAKKLFELEPRNPGNYILLSNIYSSNGMWDGVDRVRDLMMEKDLKKNPGCSWIEIKNKVYMLLAGDKSHPQASQIIEKLDALSLEMKRLGFIRRTDFVLQDVEAHDKEQILSGHSEKLAVVFGLLSTPPRTPLRIIKNLRICGDCHAVIKFISKCEDREILVRDTNRFHHFINGECSCGDFW